MAACHITSSSTFLGGSLSACFSERLQHWACEERERPNKGSNGRPLWRTRAAARHVAPSRRFCGCCETPSILETLVTHLDQSSVGLTATGAVGASNSERRGSVAGVSRTERPIVC